MNFKHLIPKLAILIVLITSIGCGDSLGIKEITNHPDHSSSESNDTLLVTLESSYKNTEDTLNRDIAQPAGLNSKKNYHITIGLIEKVPHLIIDQLKADIDQYLNQIIDIQTTPISFSVQNATTFRLLGSDNYTSSSVILVPKDEKPYKTLNLKLESYVKTYRNYNLNLDTYTSSPRYVPHITLSTPKQGDLQSRLNHAIQIIRIQLDANFYTFNFDKYKISVRHNHSNLE